MSLKFFLLRFIVCQKAKPDLIQVGCEGAGVEGEPAFEGVFRFGAGVDVRVAVGGEGGCVWGGGPGWLKAFVGLALNAQKYETILFAHVFRAEKWAHLVARESVK